MDVHRCRFVPYPASAINVLAFSHSSTSDLTGKTPPSLRLAIGRANGDIEIWNPLKGVWVQETILRGGKDRSIEGLVWTHDLEGESPNGQKTAGKLRLFSTGFSTVITEWDLALGKPIRHSGGNYGEIWCLAAQPRWQAVKTTSNKADEKASDQYLAAGCADGTIVLHVTDEGDLRFLRTLARSSEKKSRVLCMAFQNRRRIVAGYADSTIRVYDIATGQQVSSMSLDAGRKKGQPTEILVWSIKCLPDGSIVSGDSTGEVKIWDKKNLSLQQRIHSHEADVLDVAFSADGMRLISGGMDRRSTLYQRDKGGRWAEMSHRRFHSHDVKTMASYESGDLSVVVSGGPDATPIIIPFQNFGKEHGRSLTCFSQLSPVQSAPRRGLVMSWWEREVSIWQIRSRTRRRDDEKELLNTAPSRKLVAKITVQGEENLTSVCLASEGDLLAVATMSQVKMFSLKERTPHSSRGLKVQKLDALSMPSQAAKLLQFSPDGKWLLVVRPDNTTYVCRLLETQNVNKSYKMGTSVELERLQRRTDQTKWSHGSHGSYGRSITRIAWSNDSRIVVASDISGWLDSWVLEGHGDATQQDDEATNPQQHMVPPDSQGDSDSDSDTDERSTVILGQHWMRNPFAAKLPRLPTAPLVLSFRPARTNQTVAMINGDLAVHPTRHNPHPHGNSLSSGEDRLLIVTCQQEMYEYQILAGGFSDWSRRNPPSRFPHDFRNIRDRAIGCIWDVLKSRDRVWLYGTSWLWMFDLSKDLDEPSDQLFDELDQIDGIPRTTPVDRKRKRDQSLVEKRESIKYTTGAGNRVPEHELDTGIGYKLRTKLGVEDMEGKWAKFEPDRRQATNETDDDVSDDESSSDLVKLRRKVEMDEDREGRTTVIGDEAGTNGHQMVVHRQPESSPSDWHTFKYRPILGIVPLDEVELHDDRLVVQGGDDHISGAGIEVAVIERPLWDVDMPPRWEGDQEWDK